MKSRTLVQVVTNLIKRMLLSLLVMTVTVTKLHQLVLIVVKVAKKLYKAFKRKEMRMKVNNKPPKVCK